MDGVGDAREDDNEGVRELGLEDVIDVPHAEEHCGQNANAESSVDCPSGKKRPRNHYGGVFNFFGCGPVNDALDSAAPDNLPI